MRRVVATGIGSVTPLGGDAETTWSNILKGKNAAARVTKFEVEDLPSKIACELPIGDTASGHFSPDDWMEVKEQRKVDPFIVYAVSAASQALNDAGWHPSTDEEKNTTGTIIGSGIGGLQGIEQTSFLLAERGPRRVSPFFIPGRLINLASGYVSIMHGLRGPNHSVVTACSSGAHAIGDAGRMIALGDADVMVAGGAESPVCRLSLAGFAACKALSTSYNDTPKKASRPWDNSRDGFVMGEGAGIVVLEELKHARARGAKIYGELIGYGLSGDAFHITAPSENHEGAYRAMFASLKRARIDASEIDYVNAHATSTMADTMELCAVQRLVGKASFKLSMSSTKSAIGHLLGAAGSVEAIFCLQAMRDNKLPPTLNLENTDIKTPIDLVPKVSKEKELTTVLSNSFGFGGTNASLIFRKMI
ncbi:beta-ketoacyl-ACP synthase II [Candidatus Endowatersipora endosymbiont of Watersipora subatra]|uniref:beta-ketoacyl-ACP synthase II n=1 Tax=Candidatus Endowatersipora endosymbiont of Watersipora subatra TaxID=3077946 RepID=UPI00312CA0E7